MLQSQMKTLGAKLQIGLAALQKQVRKSQTATAFKGASDSSIHKAVCQHVKPFLHHMQVLRVLLEATLRSVQIQSSWARFKPGFVSYQVENAGSPGATLVHL